MFEKEEKIEILRMDTVHSNYLFIVVSEKYSESLGTYDKVWRPKIYADEL